jgi:hypothetical protein
VHQNNIEKYDIIIKINRFIVFYIDVIYFAPIAADAGGLTGAKHPGRAQAPANTIDVAKVQHRIADFAQLERAVLWILSNLVPGNFLNNVCDEMRRGSVGPRLARRRL